MCIGMSPNLSGDLLVDANCNGGGCGCSCGNGQNSGGMSQGDLLSQLFASPNAGGGSNACSPCGNSLGGPGNTGPGGCPGGLGSGLAPGLGNPDDGSGGGCGPDNPIGGFPGDGGSGDGGGGPLPPPPGGPSPEPVPGPTNAQYFTQLAVGDNAGGGDVRGLLITCTTTGVSHVSICSGGPAGDLPRFYFSTDAFNYNLTYITPDADGFNCADDTVYEYNAATATLPGILNGMLIILNEMFVDRT